MGLIKRIAGLFNRKKHDETRPKIIERKDVVLKVRKQEKKKEQEA